MILTLGKEGLLAFVDKIQSAFKLFEKQYSRNQDFNKNQDFKWKEDAIYYMCILPVTVQDILKCEHSLRTKNILKETLAL